MKLHDFYIFPPIIFICLHKVEPVCEKIFFTYKVKVERLFFNK